MQSYLSFFLFLVSFLVSLLIMPLVITLSERNGLYDPTNDRKIHKGKISRLGGLGIFLGFATAFVCVLIFDFNVQFNIPLFTSALVLSFFIGFIDDIISIKARYKLLLQLLCGLLVAVSGLQFNKITLVANFDIQFGIFSYVITMLWVAGFMNAINMLDGMDGLASGVVLIASLFVAVIGWLQGIPVVLYLSLSVVGAVLGFLLFNYPPAKIFMGDGGAYFLGFMYAVLPLIGIKKASTVTIFYIPLVLLLIPLVDVFNVMRKRIKAGYHIFIADRNHIHHRMLRIGFTNKGILWVMYSYTAILGFFAVFMLYLLPHHSLILMLLLFFLTILAFYTIAVAEKKIEVLEGKKECATEPAKKKTGAKIYDKLFSKVPPRHRKGTLKTGIAK